MKTFGINAENSISIYEGAATRPDEIIFSTEDQLALVAELFPTSRLVEIWNALPGVTPVKKFKDRATAISRIWKAVSQLEAVSEAEAPTDAVPDAVEVDGPVIEEPAAEAKPEPAEEPEPTVAEEAPQTTDVAPAGTELAEKATRAKKTPKTPRSANGTREGSKTELILEHLKREGGVSLQELMSAAGWQAHSVRGFLSAIVNKKMGLTVISTKHEDGTRIYSIGA